MKVKVNNINEIDSEKRHCIDELSITKFLICKPHMEIIRSMCNTIVEGKRTGGNLSIIDLGKCEYITQESNSNTGHLDLVGFKDCISLKKIILPSYLCPSNDGSIFSGCKNLETITVEENTSLKCIRNSEYYSEEGVLFVSRLDLQRDEKCLMKYPANKGNEYTIPQKVTEISNYAFEDSNLTTLILPEVPPHCNASAFNGLDLNKIRFMVSRESMDSYWVHSFWGKLKIEVME